MEESIRGQVALALDVDGIGGPVTDEVNAGFRAVEFDVPAAGGGRLFHAAER